MRTRRELAELLDRVMVDEAERFVATVPYARHLTNRDEPLHERYYVRHRIETVRRIRYTSRTDALALASLVVEDYEASRPWARYLAEELHHDQLYLRDLVRHGWSIEAVLAVPPLPATTALDDYLTTAIARHGALPAVAYSLFVEWNSSRYSPRAVERAGAAFSPAYVQGSKAHAGIDAGEDHYGMMLDVVHRLAGVGDREELLVRMVREIAGLLRDYFGQLYEVTIVGPARDRSTG